MSIFGGVIETVKQAVKPKEERPIDRARKYAKRFKLRGAVIEWMAINLIAFHEQEKEAEKAKVAIK